MKGPDSGLLIHSPTPPAQLPSPLSIRETPMSVTVGPVTMGGKSFFSKEGGIKDSTISNNAQSEDVPRSAPYPSGQGRGFPSASEGHIPFAYIWERLLVAMGMIANEVPTTEIKPVPR